MPLYLPIDTSRGSGTFVQMLELGSLVEGDTYTAVEPAVGGRKLNRTGWHYCNGQWRPRNAQSLIRAVGSFASPVATLTGVTSGTIYTACTIPANGLLTIPNIMLTFRAIFARTGANGTATTRINLGSLQVQNNANWAATDGTRYRVLVDYWTRTGDDGSTLNIAPAGNGSASGGDIATDATIDNTITAAIGSANALDLFGLAMIDVTVS